MKKSVLLGLTLIFTFAAAAFGQNSNVPLETILSEANKQSEIYRETFKNLLADELKTFEDFDKRGESEGKTTVKSSLLVYQSGKSANSTAELRNVLEVNGKPIPDSQRRGEEFLAELDKEKTLESELKKLQKESSKYDKTWLVYGLTLNQAVVLAPNLRPSFDFQLVGTENFGGAEVYVVHFQQKAKSPQIAVNEKQNKASNELGLSFEINVPGELKKEGVLMRGKLWIDAKTYQIWREESELIARVNDPVLLLSSNFEYQPSEFGIQLPKTISVTVYKPKKETGNKYSSLKDSSINFEYSNFRQTNVEVRILDDETN